jgi:uncharacterized FAD-dependent dehydrogenase
LKNYDIVIIGGGIGGLMTAHSAYEKNNDAKICIIDRGHPIEKRSCPIMTKKVSKCINCESCSIMQGLGGCGAYSDGKFIISTEYGGWLPQYLGEEKTIEYIERLDRILVSYGAHENVYMPSDEIKLECMKYDLRLLQAKVKHLGTDGNLKTMTKLIADLSQKIDIFTNEDVVEIKEDKHIVKSDKDEYSYKKLVVAVGRVGSGWFGELCRSKGIHVSNNQVDIGVRVELPRLVWKHISKIIYEPKILYRTKKYGDICRMFCFNDGGEVVMENSDGIMTVNGHANSDESKKTQNTNFALLSTVNFTQPFEEPIAYAKHVASLSNMVSGGGVLVQRFGDLLDGKRTNDHRIAQSTVRPTLNAVPGDLSLCIPKRQLDNIIETMYAINNIAPGTSNYDTLLYGVEAKYYSVRPDFINENFEICDDVYAIGDGSGVTRGLSQAGAMGLYVGEKIV